MYIVYMYIVLHRRKHALKIMKSEQCCITTLAHLNCLPENWIHLCSHHLNSALVFISGFVGFLCSFFLLYTIFFDLCGGGSLYVAYTICHILSMHTVYIQN